MRISVLVSLWAVVEGGDSGFFPGMDIAFVHHPSRQPGCCISCSRRHYILSFTNNNNDGSEKISDGIPTKNGDDFPAWVKALARWDPAEQPSSLNAVPRKEGITFDSFPFAVGGNNRTWIWDQAISSLVASRSGMVNVDALMSAANETEEIDLMLPNINDLKRTTSRMNDGQAPSSSKNPFGFLNNALRWDGFVPLLQRNIQELTDLIPDDSNLSITFEELANMVPDNKALLEEWIEKNQAEFTPSFDTTLATENLLRDAAQRFEFLFNGTSYAFSLPAFQSLILGASKALAIEEASGNLTAAAYNIFQEAGKAPRATAQYTSELVKYANGVLVDGFSPLFSSYPSIKNIPVQERRQKILKPAEFAALSGAIYEDTAPRAHSLGHSIIARGKTLDIGWMITDSIQYEEHFWSDSKKKDPTLVRTFVLRGYDASDGEVDREGLLNVICTASPVPLCNNEKALVNVHEGMLLIAEGLLHELEKFMDLTAPSHKVVFTGHSIGGSLAVLLMILLANDRGASFVRENILRVFTFGSPPILEIKSTSKHILLEGNDSCSILDAFDLPTDIVYGYNQPWDPIVRLFSQYDPLYPLIDDLGEDGYTPWVSGPSRTLRPVLKSILESWEGWPRYRDNAKLKLGQNYRSVGEQYLLLPEPIRYLTDRLVSVNTAVPLVSEMVQVSSRELLPALNEVFTLDTFTISYVSVAIRSFMHHFYPAYGPPVFDYAEKTMEEMEDA